MVVMSEPSGKGKPSDNGYRIHFGFSKSKHYKKALALADQATGHEIRGSGEDAWHIVTFADNQISQMAFLYSLIRSFRLPRISGVEVGLLHKFSKHGIVYDYQPGLVKGRVRTVADSLMAD